MANIGATTAFYKVETSLTRANSEVSKSMERLATGKQNANAGDRSSYVAMADTFRLDYVGTKAGIKGASVVMGYLETGMRTLDAASALLARLQELAILGSNDTNTDADSLAIDAEAEALGDEFHRLLSKATYKGKDLFVTSAGSEYVALGGRAANMTFGIEKIAYSNLYLHSYATFHAEATGGKLSSLASSMLSPASADEAGVGAVIKTANIVEGVKYAIEDPHSDLTAFGADGTPAASEKFTAGKRGVVGNSATVYKQENQLLFAASEGLLGTVDTQKLSKQIEDVQKKVNTARVQAGSQYAALESAVTYTTDLTAQYELGFNTVNDVNFSMETAHLAKNQILQQAATAMLAQANSGQQGLLQLIQG